MYVAQPFESAAFWISCSRLRLASSSSWSESIWSMPGRANSLNPSLSPKPCMAVVIDLDDSLKTAVSSVEWNSGFVVEGDSMNRPSGRGFYCSASD